MTILTLNFYSSFLENLEHLPNDALTLYGYYVQVIEVLGYEERSLVQL